MADLASLGFSVNTSGLTKGERAMKGYSATGRKMEKNVNKSTKSMGAGFSNLAAKIGIAAAALLGMNKMVSVTREFNVLNAQLITATGSAENAAVAFSAIQKFAAETPYDLAQATKAFTQLVNLGLTPSEAAMTSYGNTASAMGKDLSQMVEAVADATVGEFERLKEFGIKSSVAGEEVSFTFRGITTTIQKEAAAIEGYLMALGENEFAGAMAERAKTLDGAISNLGDGWDSLFLTVSNQGVGEVMHDSIKMASGAITDFEDLILSGSLGKAFDAITGIFDGIVDDVGSLLNLVSELVGSSADGWYESIGTFIDKVGVLFVQFPEMIRFAVKSGGVLIASFVNVSIVHIDRMVDIFQLRFDRLVEIAKIDGKAIADSLNPFSDFSNDDWNSYRREVLVNYAGIEQGIVEESQKRADEVYKIRDEMINGFLLESAAHTDLYKQRMDESDELIKKYKEEKEARSSSTVDALARFKIVPDGDAGDAGVDKDSVEEYAKWLNKIESSTGILEKLEEEILSVWLAMDAGDISDVSGLEAITQMEEKVKSLKAAMSGTDLFMDVTSSSKQALTAIQGLSEDGSKSYMALGLAVQALSALQAINGVINQATGDPYTAFGRMVAMAGVMASLGQMISIGGGGFDDESADIQADQGLNFWGEKSDSIDTSVDIIANATEDLVSINTDMLKALITLQDGINAAAGIVARETINAEFTFTPNVIDDIFAPLTGFFEGNFGIFGDIIGGIFGTVGGWFGGSSSVTDSGIQINGGTIEELRENADVFAYQDTKSKSWAWGSTSKNTEYQYLDDASQQFSLVFDSIANSVYEAGIALGFAGADLEASINEFEIAGFEISLKGLSVEEQEEEISAAFSEIFNDLAEHVFPFVDDFIQTGEEFAETLVRLATEVAIANVLMDDLGISFGSLAGEDFIAAADNISNLVGGVDEFSSSVSSFIDNFASDEVKLNILSGSLSESLSDVGLGLPSSADGFYDLMTGIDASTEAGQAQIAVLLGLSDVASEYYDMLNQTEESMADLSDSFASAISDIYDVSDGITQVSLDAALAAAKLGDFDLAEALDTSDYMLDQSDFTSMSDFNIAQAEAASKLLELSELAAAQAGSVETQQLDELKSINQSIIDAAKAVEEQAVIANKIQADNLEILEIINTIGIEVRT